MTCRILSTAIAVTLWLTAGADQPATIADVLNDSTSITVVQPDALNARLVKGAAGETDQHGQDAVEESTEQVAESGQQHGKTAGYRVQVFSDNNARTAKTEARSKERNISEAFPQYATYVVYNSPYWRLKIGDFRTHHEAQAAADEISHRFPSYAREIRVVRDRINVH